MNFKLLQYSIVVIGDAHNPSILNPDFLAIQGIVPNAWGWSPADGSVTSPMFAGVRYDNGVSIQVEQLRMQVLDQGTTNPNDSKIPEIVSGYLNTLPHVRYTAIGINFNCAMLTDEPGQVLRDRFLSHGQWRETTPPIIGAGVKLLFARDSGRLTLSLDPGEVPDASEGEQVTSRSAILASGNLHRILDSPHPHEQAIKYLRSFVADWALFQDILRQVTAGEA